jgi:hypothetical protein
LFQGRDLSKTLNIAVSSRALFDLKEEHDTFETKGLDEYIKMQVEKENVVLLQGSAFPFIKVNMIFYFFSCGPKSYFTLFCNLIGYASGPYEPVRTARDLKP